MAKSATDVTFMEANLVFVHKNGGKWSVGKWGINSFYKHRENCGSIPKFVGRPTSVIVTSIINKLFRSCWFS